LRTQTHCPQVTRTRLREEGKHNRDHVLVNFGWQTDPAKFEALETMLNKEREHAREWATERVKVRMLNKAMQLNMTYEGRRVSKFVDIGSSWGGDNSDCNARKAYIVMFGDYEGASAKWSMSLEKEYMEELGREYYKTGEERGTEKRGCYEKIITKAKTNTVRLLNRRSKLKILMSKPSSKKDDEKDPSMDPNLNRRRVGDFYLHDPIKVKLERKDGNPKTTILTVACCHLFQLLFQKAYYPKSSVDVDLVAGAEGYAAAMSLPTTQVKMEMVEEQQAKTASMPPVQVRKSKKGKSKELNRKKPVTHLL
jgi:ribosomal protein L17